MRIFSTLKFSWDTKIIEGQAANIISDINNNKTSDKNPKRQMNQTKIHFPWLNRLPTKIRASKSE